MKDNLYYSPINLHLSGREYVVLKDNENGSKLIQFPSFGNETILASPDDLDGTYKKRCERMKEEERKRIAKVHGW